MSMRSDSCIPPVVTVEAFGLELPPKDNTCHLQSAAGRCRIGSAAADRSLRGAAWHKGANLAASLQLAMNFEPHAPAHPGTSLSTHQLVQLAFLASLRESRCADRGLEALQRAPQAWRLAPEANQRAEDAPQSAALPEGQVTPISALHRLRMQNFVPAHICWNRLL